MAILQILVGVIYLIAGLGVGLVGGIMGGFFGLLGGAIGFFLIALGVVEFVVAWGYLTRRAWARWAGLALAAIGIIEGLTTLPGGLLSVAIDGAVVYYLTRPRIIAWFTGREYGLAPPQVAQS